MAGDATVRIVVAVQERKDHIVYRMRPLWTCYILAVTSLACGTYIVCVHAQKFFFLLFFFASVLEP